MNNQKISKNDSGTYKNTWANRATRAEDILDGKSGHHHE
jgi:hypothetical protein